MPVNPLTVPLFARVAPVVGGALLVLLAGALLREWRRRSGRSQERALLVPTLTAVVVVVLLTLALFAGGVVLTIFCVAVAAVGAHEYANMTRLDRTYRFLLVTWSAAGLLLVTFAHTVHVLLLLPVSLFLAAASVPIAFGRIAGTHRQAGAVLFGYVYIGLPMAYLLLLRADPTGLPLLLVVIAGAWLADTCGYAIGAKLGGPKLAPAVSPNKTWSGAAGSVLGAVAGVALLHRAVGAPGGPAYVVLLGAVTGVGAILGDLVESAVKRDWNVKDTGASLPGFGGVLDRFDSLLLAVPAAYYLMLGRQYFGR
jgi:phosphatidate cytidylyltransferase